MKLSLGFAGGLALSVALSCSAAELFPLRDVRLSAGPFLEAQQTDLRYLLALDADRLLAPFRREAGLPLAKTSYGNWESSGLDGHMGGHYLSALALMAASTDDPQVRERLAYFVAELKKCQGDDGYLGGIPGGRAAWAEIAQGRLHADNFSVNGKWVPWYNLHKTFAGLRDSWQYAGNEDARAMLVKLSDWALTLTAKLSDAQLQAMLKSEHGGMNEVLADVATMTGDMKYLHLARRFSHQAILQPLAKGEDRLTGLHANTQIPKVIGFERIAQATGEPGWDAAARTFWQTVVDKRSVAIGGNSVKEHFHDSASFASMIDEVEGPETCNTYNMLKLTALLFQRRPALAYADYYERALYNHILASQRPETGGFVYFTPMRPNHYRVYSKVDEGMWCCVGSGIESHAKHAEFIYAHEGNDVYVNLYIASTLDWKAKGIRISQQTRFPDESTSRLTMHGNGSYALKLRYPGWVKPGAMRVKVDGKPVDAKAGADGYVRIERAWRDGDTVDVTLPMTTRLEQMPDRSNYYAVLHGPIVLAAKTAPFPNEKLNYFADDSRMGHIAQGPTCPQEAAPLFVSDTKHFMHRFRPVPGQPLTFTAPGLVQGADVRFIPFFRLHDSRYMVYWQYSTPAGAARLRARTARDEADRIALAKRTVDQVAPGEQQPESDHGFEGEGADAGIHAGRHWRHATGWFGYRLNDKAGEGRVLRLTFAAADAGRAFDILVNGKLLRSLTLQPNEHAFYDVDIDVPAGAARDGALTVKFVARPGSLAGGLYGLRLLRTP